jgi:GNAT superfamily N-acetyltransferase
MRVRPMRVEDLDDAGRVATTDGSVDGDAWERRAAHLLRQDAAGCWVAEGAGRVLGVALSLRRELLWGLPVLAVLPEARGHGVGKALLEAALGHSRGCLRGVGLPRDGRGARRARLAGFHLHPTMRLTGVVDRSLLPVVEHVRDGVPGDFDLCDSVARQARGAAHGVDHEVLVREGYLLLCDTFTGSAFAYVAEGGPLVVAGTSRLLAQRVLWEALARSAPGSTVEVPHLTADQDWAVEVGLAAGLSVEPHGWIALRHMRPPSPYVPSSAFL